MSQTYTSNVWIGEPDFDIGAEYKQACLSAPHAGAVVFFVGLVRELYSTQNDHELIEYLELQHYPSMTEALCEEIISEAHARYPFDHARLSHRVGRLYSSEQIVFVAVASKHRENAFQASQFIMDYLKTRATFWKKEVGSRGSQWLGVKEKDKAASKRWS